MLRMPVAAMARFCRDHGLLRALRSAAGRSVPGGADVYVRRMLAALADARLTTPVRRVRRLPIGGADVSTDRGTERFDAVVFACHSVDALALLADPSADEREVLGAFHYQRNRAILHTDAGVLPLREAAWAAWNYEAGRDPGREAAAVCVHVLVNRLQPPALRGAGDRLAQPDPGAGGGIGAGRVPLRAPESSTGARSPPRNACPPCRAARDSWFCGAWTGLGSHEDGLASAARRLRPPRADAASAASPCCGRR